MFFLLAFVIVFVFALFVCFWFPFCFFFYFCSTLVCYTPFSWSALSIFFCLRDNNFFVPTFIQTPNSYFLYSCLLFRAIISDYFHFFVTKRHAVFLPTTCCLPIYFLAALSRVHYFLPPSALLFYFVLTWCHFPYTD